MGVSISRPIIEAHGGHLWATRNDKKGMTLSACAPNWVETVLSVGLRYRFYDKHALLLTAEHRWQAFSGLDRVLFVDAGKVASRRADVDFSEVTGEVGFRFKLNESYIMRIDFGRWSERISLHVDLQRHLQVGKRGSVAIVDDVSQT